MRRFRRYRYIRSKTRARRLLISAAVVITFFLTRFAENRLPLLHEEAVHAALNRFAQEKFSETVPTFLNEVTAKHEGELVLQDTYRLNQIKSSLTKGLQKELTGKTVVWIPFGDLTGVSLLQGHGFKIPLVFSVIGSADAEFITSLSGAGINRTRYSIAMEVTAELYSLSVKDPVALTVKSSYLIYEGVLEGETPRYTSVVR